jgi:anti-sigma B factor antagonist
MQSVLSRPNAVAAVSVLRPQGHVNAASATELQRQLNQVLLSAETIGVQVDMSQVESLDSAGLMVLVAGLSVAQRLDKPFSLCAVSASIRIIFELTQLDRVFDIAS